MARIDQNLSLRQGASSPADGIASSFNDTLLAQSTGLRTYEAQLYGGRVTATPLGAPGSNGQTLWQVTARTGDGRNATVNVHLTEQFGAEQLRPGSPTKRQLDAAIAAQAPGGGASAPAAPAAPRTYEARLYGGTVTATPLGAPAANGHTLWQVTARTGDGRTATVNVRLTGQFGPDQLVDGSYAKNQIGAQILAARARDIPASVSEASFRNLGMDGASAPVAAELYRSMRDQGHGVAQSWSGVWRAYLDGYASGGPAGGRRSLATTVTNPPPSNLSNIPPAEADAVVAGGGRIVGEPFDARPFGNRASIYQVLNRAGNYELRLRLNDPQQYRQSDFLVFENAGRPIDMSRDYTHRLADGVGPIPNPFRTVGSPLYAALNDTLNQALSQENRAPRTAPAGTPMSDNPLVRFYRGAGGAVRGLTGDSIEFLGRVLPYLNAGATIMPITLQAVQGKALNLQIANQTSARIGDSIRDLNDAIGFAIGVPPDSPEVTFGRIAIGVAEGVEGIFNLGRGALNLVRNSDGVWLAVRNASILNRFRNPSPDELGRVVSFVNGIGPDQYAAIPVNLKVAMREGLGANRSAPGVQQALARLDNLDGLSPVAVNPGAGASSAPTPTRPKAPTTAAPGVLAPRPSPNPGALDDFLPTAPARPAVPTAPAFNAELGTRFGLPIRQSFEGGVFVARLGDDPASLITSRRPMTGADFRQGPGRDALEARNPANARVATNPEGDVFTVRPPTTGASGAIARPDPRLNQPGAVTQADLPLAGDNAGVNLGGDGSIVPAPEAQVTPAVTSGTPSAGSGDLATLAADPAAAQNAATLQRIRTASPAEINEWMEGLSVEQRLALPTPVQDAILDNVRNRISSAAANVNPAAAAHPLANDPSLQRYGRELLKDMTLQMEAGEVSQRVSQHGPFKVVLLDSGNGGLAAAGVAADLLSQFTGGRVQLVTMGDHQNQPYGSKNEQQITGLVFNAIEAGASLDPDVIAMACNTACIALFRANETNMLVPSNGVPVLNLIDNTSRVVADPANRTAFGDRPLILSTQATADSDLYQKLIPQYSNGEVTPYNVGGSDAPVTTPDGRTEIRDLATLVNQLAHRNQARQEEVMNAARHYVAKMPEDMTSLVMCCTHYPELIPFFRRALDERGMQHVPIFDPMPDQILSIVRTLDQSVAGVTPPAVQRPTGPNAVITSATGRDNPGTTPGSGLRTFEDVFRSVPTLTGQDAAVFSGQNFGADYDPTIVRRFLDGELSAVDAATVGFHGRNLHTFFNPGGALDAATALNDAQNVMLLTGFNVPPNPADPTSIPRPETDGPPGTAALANGLLNLGRQVTIVTDTANRPVVEASLRDLGADLTNPRLNIVEFNARGRAAVAEASDLIARINPDVVGAIELPGRNQAGQRTNMGGIVIDEYNADLDTILIEAGGAGVTTFGVGDGGNEAGMGNLDLSRVALRTPSVVGADIAVTAENSNLGAYAILAELAGLTGRLDLLLTLEQLRASVAASVQAGAVDGVSRRPENTVDGFSLGYHEGTIKHLNGAIQGTWPPAPR